MLSLRSVVLLVLLLPSVPGFAQSPPSATPSPDSMRFVEMAPVVVTATRTVKELEDVAVPTTVVLAEQMRAQGAVRLSDVLEELTGMVLFDDHGTGIQIQGLDPEYTLILLDGEPIIGRTAGTLSLERLAVAGIERVEIVRGPSSSLYGSEALAGVVNLITQPPAGGVAATLSSRYGTHQATDLTATIQAGGERVGGRLLVSRYSSGGYDLAPDVFGPTAPQFADYTTDLRFRASLNERATFKVGARLARQQQEHAFALTEDEVDVPHDQADQRTDWSIHPELRYRLSSRWQATGTLYLARYQTETQMTRRADGASYYEDAFDQRFHKAEVQFNAFWNAHHMTTLGGGGVAEALGGDRYAEAHPEATSGFFFAQHEWLPSRLFDLTLSARFDAHTDYAARLSPKVSLLVRPLERLRLRASVGSGFKAPDFRQLYLTFSNSAIGYSVFGSTQLAAGIERLQADGLIEELFLDPSTLDPIKSESSVAFNVGLSAEPTAWMTVSLGAFRNNIQDLIETQPVALKAGGSFVYTYFNLDQIRTQGLEAEATWTPLRSLTLGLGYQYLQARDQDVVEAIRDGRVFGRSVAGRDYALTLADYGGLFGRSKHSGTIHATWRHARRGVTLAVRSRWRSRYGYRDTDGNGLANRSDEFVPGYALWNATLTKDWTLPFAERLSLQLGAENLFDVVKPSLVPSLSGRLLYAGFSLSL